METAGSSPIVPSRRIFIAGPTAVGKSEIALRLAEKIGGEIISVDSMQVYRGMNLGTSKPSADERARIPHHLVDVCELSESFDAARFCQLAGQAAVEIESRNRVPIFCGGSGLYFRAFLEGLGDAPPANPAVRIELEQVPLEALLLELEKSDPATFARIDRQNRRRVLRAVEVFRITGKPFSPQRAAWTPTPRTGSSFFALKRTTADLQARINGRVDRMFANGLVEETRQLLERGLNKNPTAMQALGYRQIVEMLQKGRPLLETIELVKIRTRQFAKRQMTWFQRQSDARWLDLTTPAHSAEATAVILSKLAPP